MIHPTDFDSSPPADPSTTEPSSSTSPVVRPFRNVILAWTIAGALALLSAIALVGWQSASQELRIKTTDLETVQSQIREMTQQRDALQAQVSSAQGLTQQRDALQAQVSLAQGQFKDAARLVRVTVTAIRLFSVSDGAETELNDTAAFDASALQTMEYRVEGTHPICGTEALSEPITVRLVMPDGTTLRHDASPEGATSSLTPECGQQGHQWIASEKLGYGKPGVFMVGMWQLLIIDRGMTVGQKSFEVR